tara:strand:+ start:195 stop:716 length:522 start_codon:yes stop_codon:yes gene_type:complete
MGTRSRIGLALGPDQIVSAYCHYDGYIQHNGRKLVEHFNTKELVEKLIDGGDMSSMYTTHTWETRPFRQVIIAEDGTQSVDYPRDSDGNWIYSPLKAEPSPQYYSERGENVPPKMSTFDEFLSDDSGEEWCYLFTPGTGWQCWKLGWGETNTQEYDLVTEEPLMDGLFPVSTF